MRFKRVVVTAGVSLMSAVLVGVVSAASAASNPSYASYTSSSSECTEGKEDVTINMPPRTHQGTYSDMSWDPRFVCIKVTGVHAGWSYGKTVWPQVEGPGLEAYWPQDDGRDAYWTRGDGDEPARLEGEHPKGDVFYAEVWANAPFVVYIRPNGRGAGDEWGTWWKTKVEVPEGGVIPGKVHGVRDSDWVRVEIKCAGDHWVSVRGDRADTPARLVGVLHPKPKWVAWNARTGEFGERYEYSRLRTHLDVGKYWIKVAPRKGVSEGRYRVGVGASSNLNGC